MPEGGALFGFVVAALVVLLVPGPGVFYILARSLSQGQRAGVVSAAGLSFGVLAHVIATTAGVGALLLASATAFGVVKVLGAAYLIYLGLRTIFIPGDASAVAAPTRRSSLRLFKDGVLVSVLNPKVAVFFLAFLPQFVTPSNGSVTMQLMTLGMLYAALAFCTDSAYAILAGWLRDRLRPEVVQGPMPRLASGTVYIGLGLSTALGDGDRGSLERAA